MLVFPDGKPQKIQKDFSTHGKKDTRHESGENRGSCDLFSLTRLQLSGQPDKQRKDAWWINGYKKG